MKLHMHKIRCAGKIVESFTSKSSRQIVIKLYKDLKDLLPLDGVES
jgi:hypothetical protein